MGGRGLKETNSSERVSTLMSPVASWREGASALMRRAGEPCEGRACLLGARVRSLEGVTGDWRPGKSEWEPVWIAVAPLGEWSG